MAKTISATKGGLTITNGHLDIVGARFVKYTNPGDPPVAVTQWLVEWALFASAEEAAKPLNAGRRLEAGFITLPYVAGNDPVQDAYELMQEKFEEEWEVTSSTEVV